MAETLTGKISKIFFNKNDYIIGRIQPSNSRIHIGFKGKSFGDLILGTHVILTGNIVTDIKWGDSFVVDSYKLKQSYDHIYYDFLTTKLRGLGEETFKKLWNVFGEDSLVVIEDNNYGMVIDKNIKGISKTALARWSSTLKTLPYKPSDFIKLKVFTNDLLKTRKLESLIDFYSGIENVFDILNTNAYKLINYKGLSFTVLDNIAKKNPNFNLYDDKRIVCGIYNILKELPMEGHSCLPKFELVNRLDKLLGIDSLPHIDKALINELFFIYKDNYVYLRTLYHQEYYVVEKIKSLLERTQTNISDDVIRNIVEQDHLYEDQKQALLTLLSSPFSVLTGPPGTGKTYTIKSLIDYFKLIDKNKKIALASPTGKAARRVSEQSGHSASTIHLLLKVIGFSPDGDGGDIEFEYSDSNPLPYDIIIIDETSMLNIELAYHLFSAIDLNSIVILIGDHNQLPPIGSGYLLKSLIDSKANIPVVILDEIKRQAKGSMIIQNCHNIIKNLPIEYEAPNSDFQFIELDDMTDIQNKCVELLDEYGFDKTQIITPLRSKTELSCSSLNYLFRERYKPDAQRLYNFKEFRVGDKVIQNSNNYMYNIYNGQIGYVLDESRDDGEALIKIDFDGNIVQLTEDDAQDITLAYAITGHKFQGSESEFTIIPIHEYLGEYLVNRNWVYTSISRARKKCMLVGQKKEFELSLQRNEDGFRYSVVQELFNAQI